MAVWRQKIIYSVLGISAVVLPAEQWASARPILRAVGDFGSCRENDTPDGIDDLLWHDEETAIVAIQYLNADGVSVRNVPGSVANIRILNRGDGYFSSDELILGHEGTGGQGFVCELNIIGPIDDVIINDPGRDYGEEPSQTCSTRILQSMGEPDSVDFAQQPQEVFLMKRPVQAESPSSG